MPELKALGQQFDDENDGDGWMLPFWLSRVASAKLRTRSGTNLATDGYWGRSQAVWNDGGDTEYRCNSGWQLVEKTAAL